MELDFTKKNRRDKMIRSKSFERQEVRERDRPEGSWRVERLFPSYRRKGMHRPGMIKSVKKKIYARARKGL